MNRVRLGICGAGNIAQEYHLPAYQKVKEAESVAICDIARGDRNTRYPIEMQEILYAIYESVEFEDNLTALEISAANLKRMLGEIQK
ncbi:MAG: hypothetical protein IJX80_07225 [Clostridia bacterium]|nr:hypothetical protein [Clostridia bacterium]